MISSQILQSISNILGPEGLRTRPEDLEPYSKDATRLIFMPDAVAFPRNTRDVSKILAIANAEGFPVIPRGAGSGKSGGALPVEGGLVLSLEKLNRILEIDEENLIAKVEPGVITADLQEAVEKHGLFYPPDPASIKISTIGGNVAECAGGLRAVKYGVTRDYVLGLTVVLPGGEILKTGVETAKGVVGYDLTRLIVGSEGTLAVITAITLRLIPMPAAKGTMIAYFDEMTSAVRIVSALTRRKVIPTILEFMDRLSLECVRDEMARPFPSTAKAMLLIEVDGDPRQVENDVEKVGQVCREAGALRFEEAFHKEEVERLWDARRNVSEALFKLKPHKISEDIVVPRNRLADFIGFLEALSLSSGLPLPAFGHAGDGNIHVNLMHDQADPNETGKLEGIIKKVFEKVLELGGTISGEHGIGLTKSPYLSMEIPKPAFDLMIRLKNAFDPKGILNPGKIFVEPE
jgi:glycolate oxidase